MLSFIVPLQRDQRDITVGNRSKYSICRVLENVHLKSISVTSPRTRVIVLEFFQLIWFETWKWHWTNSKLSVQASRPETRDDERDSHKSSHNKNSPMYSWQSLLSAPWLRVCAAKPISPSRTRLIMAVVTFGFICEPLRAKIPSMVGSWEKYDMMRCNWWSWQ